MAKKIKKLKEETPEELKKKLVLLRSELQVLKFKAQGSKSKNVKEGANLRKDIARVLTAINNK
jgi:ribosomal protein L29